MKSERRRAKRAERRALIHRAVKLANKTRKANDLCSCGVDTRYYASQDEADGDRSPAIVCDGCGKAKLRVALIDEGPTSRGGRITLKGASHSG